MSDAFRLAPKRAETAGRVFDMALSTGKFDPDVWHVMNERDNALVADTIINGALSTKFIYSFDLAGTQVAGISVVGARHLAYHYGGMHHRMVASVEKRGTLLTYTSYPNEHSQMTMTAQRVPDLESEPDFYQVVTEVQDIKRGNIIQMERREQRFEWSAKKKAWFERPHLATIAQAKAYRNAVLAIIPQDVAIEWRQQMMALGKTDIIIGSVIEEKRSGVLRYAASKAIGIDRDALGQLTMDQIAGLADAAREGQTEAFHASADALGLLRAKGIEGQSETRYPPAKAASPKAAAPAKQDPPQRAAETAAQAPTPAGPHDAAPHPGAASGEPENATSVEHAPPFEAALIDAYGEPETDASGAPSIYTDPVEFARALVNRSLDGTDLSEHNADGIADAMAASPAAAEMLATIMPPPKPAAPKRKEDRDLAVPVAYSRTGAVHQPNYRAAIEKSLAEIGVDHLTDWLASNWPAIQEHANATTRLNIIAAIRKRCAELGIAPPAFEAKLAPAAPDDAAPAPEAISDDDATWNAERDYLLRIVADAAMVDDLLELERNVSLVAKGRMLKEARPSLYAQFAKAAGAKMAALKAAP